MTKTEARDATKAALRGYDKALAAEREAARDNAADLRAMAEQGLLRGEAAREAAADAYAAYRDARDKWDALSEKS